MSDLIRREDVVEALYQAIRTTLTGTFKDSMSLAIAMANNLPSVEPERTTKVVDTWKVAGYDELNAWCPECEHRITRGCSYCPTCGVKLDWSE